MVSEQGHLHKYRPSLESAAEKATGVFDKLTRPPKHNLRANLVYDPGKED